MLGVFLYDWFFGGGVKGFLADGPQGQDAKLQEDMNHGRPCRMLCLSLGPPKGHPKPSHLPWGSFQEGWTQPAQGIRVQSQALGTACPSALMLEAQEKSQACQCQKHGLGAHFFFPRAGEGMRG